MHSLVSVLIALSYLLISGPKTYAQEDSLQLVSLDTINQRNEDGEKHGYWIVYGVDAPEKEYPLEGIIEEGTYANGFKNGVWKKYYKDGKTVRLEGNYKDNRPCGDFKYYYEDGTLKNVGSSLYSRRQLSEEFYRSGRRSVSRSYGENGSEDGIITFYYDSLSVKDSIPQIEFQYEKENGITIGQAVRYYYSGCLRELIEYNNKGVLVSRVEYCDDCLFPIDTLGSQRSNCYQKDKMPNYEPILYRNQKKEFLPNGYNKVFDENNLIVLDGNFKNSKMWKGKLYLYNDKNQLIRIELWENGKFHSNIPIN